MILTDTPYKLNPECRNEGVPAPQKSGEEKKQAET